MNAKFDGLFMESLKACGMVSVLLKKLNIDKFGLVVNLYAYVRIIKFQFNKI